MYGISITGAVGWLFNQMQQNNRKTKTTKQLQ